MKKLNFIFILLFNRAIAGEGITLVLESPIYQTPSYSSLVVQTIRKGEKIFIHDKHFFLKRQKSKSQFYETVTKIGDKGFIPKKYVKLIYNDKRENWENISPFTHDPTDYRIEEPLKKSYPFIDKRKFRAVFQANLGMASKDNYQYQSFFEKESYTPTVGMALSYSSKVSWDRYDRFYFGGQFQIFTSRAKFHLFDNSTAEEARGIMGIGPYISYDILKTQKYRFTISNSILLNWKRFLITRTQGDLYEDERIFSTLVPSSKFCAFIAKRRVLLDYLDFIAGLEFQIFTPHTLSSDREVIVEEAWNTGQDQIDFGMDSHLSLFIGFQSHY